MNRRVKTTSMFWASMIYPNLHFLKFLFEKDSPNQYRSRLGFNLHPLLVGYYTMVVEWFPPEMYEVSMTPQATTI